jgi:hypothetical protein
MFSSVLIRYWEKLCVHLVLWEKVRSSSTGKKSAFITVGEGCVSTREKLCFIWYCGRRSVFIRYWGKLCVHPVLWEKVCIHPYWEKICIHPVL